jgi:hypothetical protein
MHQRVARRGEDQKRRFVTADAKIVHPGGTLVACLYLELHRIPDAHALLLLTLFGVADNNGYGLKVFAFLKLAGVGEKIEAAVARSKIISHTNTPCKEVG